VAVALRTLAAPFRQHAYQGISAAQHRSVAAGRAGRRLRRGTSGAVEPCASVSLLAAFAGHAAQPAEVLPDGRAKMSDGSRRATIC